MAASILPHTFCLGEGREEEAVVPFFRQGEKNAAPTKITAAAVAISAAAAKAASVAATDVTKSVDSGERNASTSVSIT